MGWGGGGAGGEGRTGMPQTSEAAIAARARACLMTLIMAMLFEYLSVGRTAERESMTQRCRPGNGCVRGWCSPEGFEVDARGAQPAGAGVILFCPRSATGRASNA